MNQPAHTITAAAWDHVERAVPLFQQFFVLTDSGVTHENNHPEYQRLWRAIMNALGIDQHEEHTALALLRICPAAQYARGHLRVEVHTDGTRSLFTLPQPAH